MNARSLRPTMADVAREAGVSAMTVSYAYSQPERVSDAAAEKVRRAAGRLGYPGPHPGARSLRRGRAGSLGVVMGEPLAYAFDDPQAARFLAGVAEVCAAERVGLTLVPITGAADDVDRVGEAAVDGFVVWTTADDDPVVDAVAATGLPGVVHAGPQREGLAVVGIDDRRAAGAIAREAFANASRPAVISFPLDRNRSTQVTEGLDAAAAAFPVTRHRLEGFREAADDWAHVPVAVCERNSAAEGERAAEQLLALPDPPDAIAAMSDELALGALRANPAWTVTGWDDGDAAAAAGLTTVAQSLREQGALCARLALAGGATGVHEASWRIVRRLSA